jgi:uncharacterized membrane protein
VRALLAAVLVPAALASVAGVVLLYPHDAAPAAVSTRAELVHARVTATAPGGCAPPEGQATQAAAANTPAGSGCVLVSLLLTDGAAAGRDIVTVVPLEPSTPSYRVGDAVVAQYNGGDPGSADSYQVVDFQRGTSLWVLGVAFAAAVIALGRWRGLAALVALGVSFVVLVAFILPAILAGRPPLATALVGSCLILFAVLYLSHGFSARTSTAVLGTLVSLGLIGALSAAFTGAARLTGLDESTANLIAALGGHTHLDARGLLLAGFVIGALGVLDDVTVTQTSAVWELAGANPALGPGELFASGMRIGRDHISSAVNTLVLAYAGAALPLLLFFTVSGLGLGASLSSQDVAAELVRTLVGAIGLVASVPVTTGVAALVAASQRRR